MGEAGSGAGFIRIEGVSKAFGDFVAVRDVSLEIARGEFFALLGGSGCGKTTLLRMLAGFDAPTGGRILIDGRDMTGVPPYERPVNMMFQSYALFPHMSVEKNVAYGLKFEPMSPAARAERVRDLLDMVQLTPFAGRKPHQISGGQRQRVALARALAKQPKVLLLDEPLGALDKKLREHTQFELMNLQDRLGITFVVVTHDQEEAMTLATRIAVMERGEVRQVGTPTQVYEYPASRFVAGFLGTVSLFEGVAQGTGPDGAARIIVEELGGTVSARAGRGLPEGTRVALAIRPEKITIGRERPAGAENAVEGMVQDLGYFGKDSLYRVRLASGALVAVSSVNARRGDEGARIATWDDRVWLSFDASAPIVLTD